MVDRLSALLDHFALSARVFHSGQMCGTAGFDGADGVGHLHLLRAGELELLDAEGGITLLQQPALIFFPRPVPHRLRTPGQAPAELLCASIAFGAGGADPLSAALPSPMTVSLSAAPGLAPVLDLLFAEAFGERCGRAVALDRLTELLVLELLRHAMASGSMQSGLLAGLADPRLSKALVAMHAAAAEAWTLEALAQAAGMSRARFAAHFVEVLGLTPMDYLAGWRLGLAMDLLRRGRAVGQVAHAVGYASASALSRLFQARIGCSPMQWKRQQKQ